jgi:hypothetical protein
VGQQPRLRLATKMVLQIASQDIRQMTDAGLLPLSLLRLMKP